MWCPRFSSSVPKIRRGIFIQKLENSVWRAASSCLLRYRLSSDCANMLPNYQMIFGFIRTTGRSDVITISLAKISSHHFLFVRPFVSFPSVFPNHRNVFHLSLLTYFLCSHIPMTYTDIDTDTHFTSSRFSVNCRHKTKQKKFFFCLFINGFAYFPYHLHMPAD